MTAELVEFLRAREAERAQRAYEIHDRECASLVETYVPYPCNCGEPAWVLADVAAKRQIIDEHALLDLPPEPDDDWPLVCRTCEDRSRHDAARWPCKTLRLLALPYASHPQFREEWAPDAPTG